MLHFCLVTDGSQNTILPQVQAALFMAKGIQADYKVKKIPTGQEQKILNQLVSYDGFNVGVPYNNIMGNFLDMLCPRSKAAGSVDTVVRKGADFMGYNTDYPAFVRALGHMGQSLEQNVAIIGHGAVATTLGSAILENGGKVTFLTTDINSGIKAAKLLDAGNNNEAVTYQSLQSRLKEGTLLINTMENRWSEDVEVQLLTPENLKNVTSYFDTTCRPGGNSTYEIMRENKVLCMDGIRMEVEKVAAAHNIWIGTKYTKEELNEVYASVKFALSLI